MGRIKLEDVLVKLDNNETLNDKESKLIAKTLRLLKSVISPDEPFICGNSGDSDPMGLPEYYFICPALGLDGCAIYKKHKDYSAPGW